MRGVLLLALCVKCISSLFIGDNGVLDALASQDNSELVAYGSDPDVDSESVAYGSDPEFTGTPVDEIQPLPTFSDSIFGATYLSLEGTQSPSLNFKVPGATDNENPSTLSSSAADDTSLSTWAYTGDRSSASTDLSSKVASSYLIAEPGDLNLFQLGAQGLAELAALLAYFAMELHERRFIGTPQRAPNEDFEPLKLPNYKTKRSQACPVDVYHLRDKPFCDQGLEWIKRTQVSSFDQTTYTLIKFKLWPKEKCPAAGDYPSSVPWWCCDPERAIRSNNKIVTYTDCWPHPLETEVEPLWKPPEPKPKPEPEPEQPARKPGRPKKPKPEPEPGQPAKKPGRPKKPKPPPPPKAR